MKNDKFQRAFGNIDPRLIERANKNKHYRSNNRFIVIIAAVLSFSLCIGLFTWIGRRNNDSLSTTSVNSIDSISLTTNKAFVTKAPVWIDAGITQDYSSVDVTRYLLLGANYPVMVRFPEHELNNVEFQKWTASRTERASYVGNREWLYGFIKSSISEFLSGRGDQNSVYSPLNVYFTLAIMAELEEGEGREQILSLLGAESIEDLRSKSYDIWNANYSDDGALTSILSSSLWLNEGTEIDEETLSVLRNSYYASVYEGNFEDEEYVLALRAWLNENTGGLVDKLSDVQLPPDTYMALASTIMFSARWDIEFWQDNNDKKIFHTPDGDVECEFMNAERTMAYYWGDNFSAINNDFVVGSGMWFILPDEGVSTGELLCDEELLSFIIDYNCRENKAYPKVNLSIPKFEIQSDMDLSAGFEALGLTDISGDFGGCKHGAGVSVDEEGVKASAFTLTTYGAMAPEDEVDFVLDRPFIFVITGNDGLPLFVGVVNNP